MRVVVALRVVVCTHPQKCQMHNYRIGGGKISLELSCSMADAIEASVMGTGSYREDGFELTNRMTMKSHGLELKMESQIVGKRIGDC